MEEREASASISAASLLSDGLRAEATDADPTATLHASLDALLVRHVPEAPEDGVAATLEKLAASHFGPAQGGKALFPIADTTL